MFYLKWFRIQRLWWGATGNRDLDNMWICADGALHHNIRTTPHCVKPRTTVNHPYVTLQAYLPPCSSRSVWPRSSRVCNFTLAVLPIALAGPGQWTEMRCVLPSSSCILILTIVHHQLRWWGRKLQCLLKARPPLKEELFLPGPRLGRTGPGGWGIFTP